MVLPATESFCKCVTFGISKTFQKIYKCRVVVVVGCLVVGSCWILFVSSVQGRIRRKKKRKKKDLDILREKIKLVPGTQSP